MPVLFFILSTKHGVSNDVLHIVPLLPKHCLGTRLSLLQYFVLHSTQSLLFRHFPQSCLTKNFVEKQVGKNFRKDICG